MKILISGATGFLGSHLLKALSENGHDVIGLKRRTSDITRVTGATMKCCLVNIEDGLRELFDNHSDISVIIHAATCYGKEEESLSEVLAVNVILPLQLMELASRNRNCVFFNTDTFFCKMGDQYSYLANYVLSKKLFYCLGTRVAKANRTTFVNMRLEHVFGPGDGLEKFTTSIIKRILDNEPVISLTPGEQLRDFVYVDDVVSAYIAVLNSPNVMTSGEVRCFEVGSGVAQSIRAFVTAAHQIIGSTSQLSFGSLPYRENELMYSKADSKPLLELNWTNKVDMNTGIRNIISSFVQT